MDFYFSNLLSKYRQAEVVQYRIAHTLESESDFLPFGLIPSAQRAKRLNVISYDQIKTGKTRPVRLLYQELQGGIGTGVERRDYLHHRNLGKVTSKGMDLAFEVPARGKKHFLSILEIRLLRLLRQAEKYDHISIQYFINPENQAALDNLLDKPNFELVLNGVSNKSYRQCLEEYKNVTLKHALLQKLNPTIEADTGELSEAHMAPAGHGELATLSLYHLATRPVSQSADTVRVYCKGNSVNEAPDESLVYWIANERIPIVMTARLRTPTDTYGGIYGLQKLPNGTEALQLFERYQADQTGQANEFLDSSYPQLYDTNTFLVNDAVLAPFLSELRRVIGDKAYRDIITSDLVENAKEIDGKKYIQLEGILGSPFLNLNRFVLGSQDERVQELKRKYKLDQLIYLVDVTTRQAASTSVKKGVDFWLYGHTDHFALDTTNWLLVNNRPGHTVQLSEDLVRNPYYRDLHNLIEALDGVSVIHLDYLNVRGAVKLPGVRLGGRVDIMNESRATVDLAVVLEDKLPVDQHGRLVLFDVVIRIDAAGQVRINKVSAS